MAANQIFQYNGNPISFHKGENLMVNATQMSKPFSKSPKDFLKTDQSKRFIEALSEVKKILSSDLVKVTYGNNGGTWMHEDVALEFARWLSPSFAIWCNDRIKELLLTGTSSITTPPEEDSIDVSKYGRKELAELLLESDEELDEALKQLEQKKQEVTILKYRIEQIEKEKKEKPSENATENQLLNRIERLEQMVSMLIAGPMNARPRKKTDPTGMYHTPEFYSQFPDYEYISYPYPSPSEIYRSMDLEEVRIRLFKETGVEMSPRSLRNYLCENGYLEQGENERMKPTNYSLNNGYVFAFEPEKDEKTGLLTYHPMFTEKGFLCLVSTIKQKGPIL